MISTAHQTTVVSQTQPFIELNNQGEILRFQLEAAEYRFGRDLVWSDLEVPQIGWEVLSRQQAILQREGENYRIYDGDRGKVSRNGLFINHTRISAEEGYLLEHGSQLTIGQDPNNHVVLTYFNPASSPTITPSKQRLNLKQLREFPVELGRDPDPLRYSSMKLDSPIVSRRHATISPTRDGRYTLQDLSTNGTFVNGQRVDRFVELHDGDRIRIGSFTVLYERGSLELVDRGNEIRLDAVHLVRKVSDKQGKERTILSDVSLSIEPGQLVALVGGSGAGKSTLMKTLLGIEPITSGAVYLNGADLEQQFDLYKSQIGYVPQDDIIHSNLTVEEVLSYACKLRLPTDTNVQTVIDRTLEQVKLSHVKQTFVRDLSGGQRKRVSIGVELLADPRLFFLDEPTSGLDPGLDKEMMSLLRELADQGRTIILVTHATANLEICDRVAFMGRGGKLCYFGSPQNALKFFEMPSNDLKYFADIYIKLDRGRTKQEVQATVERWATKFKSTVAYQSEAILPASKPKSRVHTAAKRPNFSWIRQLGLLSQRYGQLILRDRISLLLTLLTGPIGITLIRLAIAGKTPLIQVSPAEAMQASLALRTLFIFSCIAIWVGISCAAQEIVKEAAIYARERLVNLSLVSYLGSKLLIRSAIALLQTILIVVAIALNFQAPEPKLLMWGIGAGMTTFLTLLSSICLGLMLSTFAKNENEANNALPLIMIPQIIFSGVLFELGGLPAKFAWLLLSRWSVGAYGAIVDVNAMIPPAINLPGHALILQPIQPNAMYETTWHNLGLNWSLLILSSCIYLAIAFILQKRKDIVRRAR
ncbi:MAG: ATP-binding cassette domain-containing protein [Plectolyngbya sp. WJT66-NPBG17]|jgi:ABC-type multidrug transport system ATPase subunit/ABC-type multidrug transport system permease subunit|nr:ATP-binding cassette domain-containing protein [Plectolyngbya sp. WJT66-NPBG17]